MASMSVQLTDPSSGSFKGPFFSHGPFSTSRGPEGGIPLILEEEGKCGFLDP